MGPSSPKRGTAPQLFGPCLLWPNGRQSQLVLLTVSTRRRTHARTHTHTHRHTHAPVARFDAVRLVRGDDSLVISHREVPQSDVDALAGRRTQRDGARLLAWTLTSRPPVHSDEPVRRQRQRVDGRRALRRRRLSDRRVARRLAINRVH